MTSKVVMAAVCVAVLACSIPCLADEPDEQQDAAARQLEFMMNSVRELRLVPDDDPEAAWRFHPKPLLRWSNPVGGARDGIVVLWTDGDRPVVVATVFQSKGGDWVQESSSFASRSFVMREGNQVLWEARKQEDEFRPLEKSPMPAASGTKRLAQMRSIAREFVVFDDFASTNQTVRHELRLLSNPLYRYEAKDQGVVDGAVFVFALGTDPELILVLEAREKDDGNRDWFYRFEAMTAWAVEVKRQERTIWSVGTAPREDFHSRLIRPE